MDNWPNAREYDENIRRNEDYDTMEFLGGPPRWSKNLELEDYWRFLRESARRPPWGRAK